jgi:hypothetical protein
MTREDIIRMGAESKISLYSLGKEKEKFINYLERFADLVASAEREACAKVCETHGVHPALNVWNGGPDWYKHGKDCAEAIRARGQA